jgi:oxygen-independent coproporphyrinogen-3 oxidase
MSEIRHLYVHLPFCAHRCGYCDFVTSVGRAGEHGAYVQAVLRELDREGGILSTPLETIFVGGGTPTFTQPTALARLLRSLPAAREVTVEANPETITSELAALLRAHGVTRVSLGAQSFQPALLRVLERLAGPDVVRRAVHTLRDVGFDNISLDLLYGIPGQSTADLDADLAEALDLAPEHLSCYELEAKPGTRFTHAWGDELADQAEAMEGYFDRVVETLGNAGYIWYETANFCLAPERAGGRDVRAQHNLAYWRARDYLGLGVGAVSTIDGRRWQNAPSVRRYVAALDRGEPPSRTFEELDPPTRAKERVMLGLRLAEGFELDSSTAGALDEVALTRLERGGLVERDRSGSDRGSSIRLTTRGRFVGGGVTAEILA